MNVKKMSTTIKIAGPVILAVVIVLFIILSILMNNVTKVREEGADIIDISNHILHTNDKLIKLMRLYVITEDSATLRDYEAALDELDNYLAEISRYELSSTEKQIEAVIMQNLDTLAVIEDNALTAIRNNSKETAMDLIFGDEYINLDIELAEQLVNIIHSIEERYDNTASDMTMQGTMGLAALGLFFFISILVIMVMSNWFVNKAYWYENILDHIPLPLSITDMHRNTTFINKPVEEFLGIKRDDVIGVPCAKVWNAVICGTPNCGIECMNRGQFSTEFNQSGMDFKVDTSYLHDKKHKRTGHIEVVSDLTAMLRAQKVETELVRDIEDISRTFVDSTKMIATGSHVLAQNSTEQSMTIAHLSELVSEITGTTKESADKANKAAALAKTIKTNAEKGNQQMDEMIRAVGEINEASHSISKVIKTIDDIAFQTNILALNAAVEAARAGQHGKGFAVVAEEVRNLASKSAEAAKETGSLIQNSAEKAELGSRIASDTAASLADIVAGINESSQLIFEIAQLSEGQSLGISKIDYDISQVSQTVSQTSAIAQESAAGSEEMSSQANHLEELLYAFKRKN